MAATGPELLSVIQTSARNGTLLPSCAPEVKELMAQIDSLISQRQRNWESSNRGLTNQLQQRDRDIAALKLQVRERNTQVEHLRQESSALEREYKARYTDYEAQLEALKGEVSRLTQAYSCLRAKRQSRDGLDKCNSDREVQLQEMATENGELRESVCLLQETLHSKDELVRTLQEELAFAQSTASAAVCQSGQERLRSQLTLDRALRDELGRLKETNEVAALFLNRVRALESNNHSDMNTAEPSSKNFDIELEQLVDKHFDHLDSSVKQLLSVNTHT